MPYTLVSLGAQNLPSWADDSKKGKTFWATLFCFVLLLPVSLPRTLGALRFTSLLSFALTTTFVLTVFIYAFERDATKMTPGNSIQERFLFAEQHTHISL